MNKKEKQILRSLISKHSIEEVIQETANIGSESGFVRCLSISMWHRKNDEEGERSLTATCDKFKQEVLKGKALSRKVDSEISALEGVLRSLRGKK